MLSTEDLPPEVAGALEKAQSRFLNLCERKESLKERLRQASPNCAQEIKRQITAIEQEISRAVKRLSDLDCACT